METNGTQVPDSIIRKIQLLFDRAKHTTAHDGTNLEAEASTAMGLAQELLTKYNLELSMIEGLRVEGGVAARAEEKREETRLSRAANYKWQGQLMKTIATGNFCWTWVATVYDRFYTSGNTKVEYKTAHKVKRHVVLGRQSNVIAVEMMYEYLVDTIERVLPYPNTERLSRSAMSWREGCVERLIERIEEKTRKMKAAGTVATKDSPSTSTALAVSDLHNSEYAKNYDARYGQGAWARHQQHMVTWDQEWAESQKSKEDARTALLASETPAQRAKREAAEAKAEEKSEKENRKFWEREERKERRREDRLDHTAYYSGRKTGEEINLDGQIAEGRKTKELK